MLKILKMIWRGIRAFGLFWKDFLIGDTPEVAVGAFIVLGLTFAVRQSMLAAAFGVPAAVIALLGISIWRGTRR